MPEPAKPLLGLAPSGSPSAAAASVIAAVTNVVFLKLLATSLSVDTFGLVAAALALPSAAVFLGLLLRADAAVLAANDAGAEDRRFRRHARVAAGAAILLGLLFAVPAVRAGIGVPDARLALLAPVVAVLIPLHAATAGRLAGVGRDRDFLLVLAGEPVLRTTLLLLLLKLGAGHAYAPLLSFSVALVATTAFGRTRAVAAPASDVDTARPRRRFRSRPSRLATGPAQAAWIAYGSLLALDVMLARVLLPEDDAGRYAAVAMASRFLVLLPFPLALLLFARTVAAERARQSTARDLARVLLVTTGLAAVAVLLVHETGRVLLSLFLDAERYGDLRPRYGAYAAATAGLGVSQILIAYALARGRVSIAFIPAVVAVASVPMFIAHADSLANAIVVRQTVSILLFVALVLLTLLPVALGRRRAGSR